MKRNISNKIYECILLVTAIQSIINIIGLWITWKDPENPFGYIAGAISLAFLITCGILAFLNEKVIVRKQWMLWAGFAIVHLVFFILTITLSSSNTENAIPALFTVIMAFIVVAVGYLLLKDRLIKNKKPYTFTPTTAAPGTEDTKTDGEIVTPTVQIKVEQQEDSIPVPDFKETFVENKKNEVKQEQKPDEDKSTNEPTGVISF